MKKFLATLLTATMVASLLAGCSGNTQQDVPENQTQSDDASGADDSRKTVYLDRTGKYFRSKLRGQGGCQKAVTGGSQVWKR